MTPRLRWTLLAVVLALLAATAVTWVVLWRSGAVYDDLAAVPGVARASDVDGEPVVLLDDGLDVEEIRSTLDGVLLALADSDLTRVVVGTTGGTSDDGLPLARATLRPDDSADAEGLAAVLAVLAALPSERLTLATGTARVADGRLDVEGEGDLASLAAAVVAAADRAGVEDAVTYADVGVRGEDQSLVSFYLRCDDGLAAVGALVDRVARVGGVVAGATTCGRPTSVTVAAAGDDASAARRTAKRALGPGAFVAVRVGDLVLLDGVGDADRAVEVAAGLRDAGATLLRLGIDLGVVEVEVDDTAVLSRVVRRFAGAAPDAGRGVEATLPGGDEVSGDVGALVRALPLLTSLGDAGWRVSFESYAGRAPSIYLRSRAAYDDRPVVDLRTAEDRAALIALLRAGGWRGEMTVSLAAFGGDATGSVDDTLTFRSTPTGRARDVQEPRDDRSAVPARDFVREWDADAGSQRRRGAP